MLDTKRANVLVVDDSLAAAKRLQLSLEEAGFFVAVARNGREAWEMAQRTLFDVILTDEPMWPFLALKTRTATGLGHRLTFLTLRRPLLFGVFFPLGSHTMSANGRLLGVPGREMELVAEWHSLPEAGVHGMKTVHVFVWGAFAVLAGALVPFAGYSMQYDEEYRTVADAAQDLAPRIAAEVAKESEKRGGLLSVAVMAFGDEDGKVGESLFFAAKTLQGELTSELRNHAERKFVVWDPAQLRNKVRETGVDLAKIRVDAVEAATAELKKLGLDAAVTGSYQTGGEANGFAGSGQPIHVHADILFADGAPLQLTSNVETIEVVPEVPGVGLTGRFRAEVLVDGAALPMYVEAAEHHFGGQKFLLDLDRDKHYGKPFTIRVRNDGMPPVGWISTSERAERSRFFCAAVLVDGVNSFYQREADGEFHPSQRLPQNLTKWVLTAPGTRVLPGYDTDRNLKAQQSVRGPAGSVVDVRGFQLNDKTAALFEFADSGDSLAHEVGVTKDIGVISVYFYSERMQKDVEYFGPNVAAMAADAGARAGRSLGNSVLRVNVRTHPDPVETWQIFYRYGGHPDSVQEGRRAGKQYESVDRILDRARAEYRSAGDPFRER